MFDVIVVGAGFSGSVISRKLAEEKNLKVLLLEQRNHIAGNMYDEIDEHGVLVQRYGPHSLTTNKPWIIEYLSKYGEWFEHDIKGFSFFDNKYIRLPYNFKTVKQLLPINEANYVINKLREKFRGRDRISIFEMLEEKDIKIRNFGELIFEKAYKPYVSKQWGLNTDEIDRSVLNRVQMTLSYDERYINKDFQYMPCGGFTNIFKNLLNHKNIEVRLNCNAIEALILDKESSIVTHKEEKSKCIVFTGAIDELLNCKYGNLPYRSLDIKYYTEKTDALLPSDIVSYPQVDGYTRKTEYKKFNGQKNIPYTTISIEYPLEYNKENEKGNMPYYPVINDKNRLIYEKYHNECKIYKNLFLCGRLAEYRYYNMDDVIEHAFDIFDDIVAYLEKNDEY